MPDKGQFVSDNKANIKSRVQTHLVGIQISTNWSCYLSNALNRFQ